MSQKQRWSDTGGFRRTVLYPTPGSTYEVPLIGGIAFTHRTATLAYWLSVLETSPYSKGALSFTIVGRYPSQIVYEEGLSFVCYACSYDLPKRTDINYSPPLGGIGDSVQSPSSHASY